MTHMYAVLQAVPDSLLYAVLISFVMWNAVLFIILISQRIALNRTKKFCESAMRTTGTVDKLVSQYTDDSAHLDYYSSYTFYDEHGMPFRGRYELKDQSEYREGEVVTVYYDRNDPYNNVSENRIAYRENLFRKFLKLIPYGNLFILGITVLIFLRQMIF